MHHWFRIQQILKTSNGPGDDILQEQVYKHVGDYFMERQKWYNLKNIRSKLEIFVTIVLA